MLIYLVVLIYSDFKSLIFLRVDLMFSPTNRQTKHPRIKCRRKPALK